MVPPAAIMTSPASPRGMPATVSASPRPASSGRGHDPQRPALASALRRRLQRGHGRGLRRRGGREQRRGRRDQHCDQQRDGHRGAGQRDRAGVHARRPGRWPRRSRRARCQPHRRRLGQDAGQQLAPGRADAAQQRGFPQPLREQDPEAVVDDQRGHDQGHRPRRCAARSRAGPPAGVLLGEHPASCAPVSAVVPGSRRPASAVARAAWLTPGRRCHVDPLVSVGAGQRPNQRGGQDQHRAAGHPSGSAQVGDPGDHEPPGAAVVFDHGDCAFPAAHGRAPRCPRRAARSPRPPTV